MSSILNFSVDSLNFFIDFVISLLKRSNGTNKGKNSPLKIAKDIDDIRAKVSLKISSLSNNTLYKIESIDIDNKISVK